MPDFSKKGVAGIRARLGPVGVWSGHFMSSPVEGLRSAVQNIESLGYGSVWSGEVVGAKDIFALAAVVLTATSKITFGSGIANLWSRHPGTMRGATSLIGEAWPNRLINGIGVSHAVIIDATGQHYAKPLERMKGYLDAMDEAAPFIPYATVKVPRVLAALRPKMLALARDQADGAHPYFMPPEHTAFAREILGPDKLLIPEQAIVLNANPAEARRVAREHMALYLTLPNYTNALRHLGYGDNDLSGGGSDRLVDALVAWGDDNAIAKRVAELRANGADHVVLQPLGGDLVSAIAQLERLAPAVLSG